MSNNGESEMDRLRAKVEKSELRMRDAEARLRIIKAETTIAEFRDQIQSDRTK